MRTEHRLRLGALLVSVLFAMPGPVTAQDAGVPVSGCTAPPVPEQFKSDREHNLFVDAAQQYEACIKAYIAQRQEAAEAQTRAGNQAAAEFNKFTNAAATIRARPPQ